MMFNRDIKCLIVLLILIGFTLNLIIFLSLFSHSIQLHIDDIIPQHYDLQFIDHSDYLVCRETIFFELTQDRYQFFIEKNIDHDIELSSISLYRKQRSISIDIQIEAMRIIINKRQWRKIFSIGNYSISFLTYIKISNTRQSSFIHQYWSSKYRILFTNNHFFPFLPYSSHRSTYHLNIFTNDSIVSNLFLNQTSSLLDPSQISFAIFNQYECRSMDILQLCFPSSPSSFDFYSYLFNYTLTTNRLFQSYFSRSFPLDKLTLITTLELNDQIISKSGLVFLDQNIFLVNSSAELVLQQHQLIFLILAYQWIDALYNFDRDNQWIGKSLARTIANYLFYQTYDPMGNNHLQIERFMSTVIIDSLCNNTNKSVEIRSNEILIEKGEAFLSEYHLYLGEKEFRSLNVSAWSMHPIAYRFLHNSSSIHYVQSTTNSSLNLIPLNPFIRFSPSSWNQLLDELKSLRLQQSNVISRILFDSFLSNLVNQLSIEYPLQIIQLFFQQSFSSFTKTDLLIVQRIIKWYRSIVSNTLEEKFVVYLRKLLHPFCSNQVWSKQILIVHKQSNQQIINEILFELCCSVHHAICLQQISNRNDPQILIQFVLRNQRFDSIPMKSNQTDMLTSFNQLRMPSLFKYSDRITFNLICQTVRQHNDKYWLDLIHSIQQIFQLIPSVMINGLACAIRTQEQVDYYLTNLCPLSPFKWPCYRNLLFYSPVKTFDQLQTIDREQWPINTDELVDLFFHLGNFTSRFLVQEFQSVIFTWLTTNQHEFLHWLDNQNAYLI